MARRIQFGDRYGAHQNKTGRCFLTVPATVLGPRSSGFTLLALQSTWRAGDQYSYGGLLARNFLYLLRASGFNLRWTRSSLLALATLSTGCPFSRTLILKTIQDRKRRWLQPQSLRNKAYTRFHPSWRAQIVRVNRLLQEGAMLHFFERSPMQDPIKAYWIVWISRPNKSRISDELF